MLIVMLFFVFSSPDLIVQCYTFTDDYQSVNTAKVTKVIVKTIKKVRGIVHFIFFFFLLFTLSYMTLNDIWCEVYDIC